MFLLFFMGSFNAIAQSVAHVYSNYRNVKMKDLHNLKFFFQITNLGNTTDSFYEKIYLGYDSLAGTDVYFKILKENKFHSFDNYFTVRYDIGFALSPSDLQPSIILNKNDKHTWSAYVYRDYQLRDTGNYIFITNFTGRFSSIATLDTVKIRVIK